jgi:ferredoxin
MYLKKKDIEKALLVLAKEMEVYAPFEVDGIRRFRVWESGSPVMDGANTELPPKDILFPNRDNMYSFKIGDSFNYNDLTEAPKRAIFAIRPCDMQSILRMDKVFNEDGDKDSFYASRRDSCVIIALSCPEAGENCFCESMGIDPNSAPDADVFLADAGDEYLVKANSGKGEDVLKLWKDLLGKGKAEPRSDTHCALKPNVTADLPKKLLGLFEEKIWEVNTRACLKCGTCTHVCPTCYCFDINNENAGSEGVTFRCWDSCMYTDYALIAGGVNERPTKRERLRNRYMHKLSFFNDQHGASLCVGCGRCINLCPAHLDIAEFINKAAEVQHGE